ncbi:hypothetical protein [Ilumatobacter sp.]|uniref:hypothetical protein n=1 Tax=Ilumatobacter sp. TaxID=1967498 RepID=UPI003AF8DB89
MNTTIKVSTSTRDLLKELADADGMTLDAELWALARRERQRRMGLELAEADLDRSDAGWLDMAASQAGDASR